MIKKYASIIGFYLERHPDLVGQIESEMHVIVGDVIKKVTATGDVSFSEESKNRRSSDEANISFAP
jgi:hypothetical protein